MKKFYTIISLQQDLDDERSAYCYQAVGNPKLQLDHKTRFPIMTAMEGYTQPGEEIAVIAVVTDLAAGHRNLELFRREVEELCRRKGLVCPGVQVVTVLEDDRVATHTATFQKLLNYAADGDELFSCMTYGTKPMSTALMMAVQYAYRVKKQTTISCIVYGQIQRPERDRSTWTGRVYDMTALVQLDEIVRMLADRGVEDPKAVIDSVLAL